MLRDLVFHNRISDTALASFFSSSGCKQSLLGEFIAMISNLSTMDTANVPVPLQDLVASLAGQSFFTLRGSTKSVDHINGTGAGNSLADILFNFLIARVLRHIDHQLHDRNATCTILIVTPVIITSSIFVLTLLPLFLAHPTLMMMVFFSLGTPTLKAA